MKVVTLAALVACSGSGSQVVVDATAAGSADGAATGNDGPAALCAGRMAQPLDATWTLMVGSLSRTANVHVPASYAPDRPTPLVIDFHGRLGDAPGEANLTRSNAKADAEGFIVVYPQSASSPTSWNAGGCCDPAASSNIDDVGFTRALLDELESKLCIDTHRVFAMGMSNGGYLSHRLACELADRFAAIGPVSGTLAVNTCTPAQPVPVFDVHGNQDPLVPYAFAQQSVDYWAAKYHATSTATTYQKGAATCVTHSGGTADVVLCTIDGGGHQWPGSPVTLPLLGTKSDDLDATEAIWQFFVAHPRP